MTTNVRAFFIALAIMALALLGIAFAFALFRFLWSDELSYGIFRRIVCTIFGVVPVGYVSLGLLYAISRDIINLFKSDPNEE